MIAENTVANNSIEVVQPMMAPRRDKYFTKIHIRTELIMETNTYPANAVRCLPMIVSIFAI